MMIQLSDKCRYLYYNGIADMRISFHGLAAIVTYQMQCDVLNGDIYMVQKFVQNSRAYKAIIDFSKKYSLTNQTNFNLSTK